MSKQITLIRATLSALTAALLLAVGAAHAAPQEIVKLPRVVIVGKATPAAVQVAKIEVLPRVVVLGRSVNTQMQQPQQWFASTATAAPVAVKFTARAL